jgi:hypothetical protein
MAHCAQKKNLLLVTMQPHLPLSYVLNTASCSTGQLTKYGSFNIFQLSPYGRKTDIISTTPLKLCGLEGRKLIDHDSAFVISPHYR